MLELLADEVLPTWAPGAATVGLDGFKDSWMATPSKEPRFVVEQGVLGHAVSCELIVLWFAEVMVESPEAEIMVESAETDVTVESPEATATGGSLFPTVDSVLEEEFKTLPQYLQSMFPLEVIMIELVGLNASVGCL